MKQILTAIVLGCLTFAPAWAQDTVAKVVEIKAVEGSKKDLKYTRPSVGPKAYTAYLDMEAKLKDAYTTDANTVAALEFAIGGKVGINRNSSIEIIDEGNVSGKKTKKIKVNRGGIWAKCAKLQDPLLIQTNGGVMGIKGTEFVVEADNTTNTTKLSVLEGSVEVSDNNGQVIGMANPGDQYTLAAQQAPVKKTYEPDTLRSNLRDSPEWRDFENALQWLNLLSSWVPNANLGRVGYFANSVGAFAQIDIERDPVGAAQAALNVANSAGVNTGPVGGFLGMAGGARNNKPAKANFPTELSPDGAHGAGGQGATPTFSWKGVDGADAYVVLISPSEDFQVVEWSSKTKGTNLAYDSQARPLTKGRHYWRVVPVDGDDKPLEDVKGSQTYFEVSQ